MDPSQVSYASKGKVDHVPHVAAQDKVYHPLGQLAIVLRRFFFFQSEFERLVNEMTINLAEHNAAERNITHPFPDWSTTMRSVAMVLHLFYVSNPALISHIQNHAALVMMFKAYHIKPIPSHNFTDQFEDLRRQLGHAKKAHQVALHDGQAAEDSEDRPIAENYPELLHNFAADFLPQQMAFYSNVFSNCRNETLNALT